MNEANPLVIGVIPLEGILLGIGVIVWGDDAEQGKEIPYRFVAVKDYDFHLR